MLNLKNKAFLIALLGLFFANNKINAQNKLLASVLRAGYNNSNMKLSNFTTIPDSETTSKHGYYINYGIESRFAERVSFIFGAEYIRANSYLKSKNTTIEGKMTVNYLSGNLDLKFYPTYDLGIYAGGFFALPFNTKFALQSPNNNLTTNEKKQQDDINNELKDFVGWDMGVHFGLDYRIFDQLHIEAFYRWGISNSVLKKSGNNTNREMKVNSINVGLNYRFNFESK